MTDKPLRYPPDKGLGKPYREFHETFSAETVVLDHFFPKCPECGTRRGHEPNCQIASHYEGDF